MTLDDLIDFIIDSKLEQKEKEFLIKNLNHLREKFKEKYHKDVIL